MQINNLRQKIWLLVAVIVFIFAIILLVSFINTGKLIVHAGGTNTITVTNYNDASTSGFSKTGKGTLSINLHTGKYRIVVEGGSIATAKVITIDSRKTTEVNLTPINPSAVEPVSYGGQPQNLYIGAAQLLYLDAQSGLLTQIDGQNTVTTLNPSIQFTNVQWSKSGSGIGQDVKGRLYTITDGEAKPITLPKGDDPNEPLSSYSIAPNGTIYVSMGKYVFIRESGHFKHLYTADSDDVHLFAADGKVAVAIIPRDAGDEGGEEKEGPPSLAIVDNSGKSIKRGISIDRAAWSPDGNFLAATGTDSAIFNDQLKHVGDLPNVAGAGGNNLAWSGDSFFYSMNDQLWSYGQSKALSRLIANTPLGETVSDIATSADGNYIYLVSVDDDKGAYALRRVGLAGKKVSPALSQLQTVLPQYIDGQYLSIVNFTHPTITVQPSDFSAPIDGSIIQAQNSLRGLGIDLNGLDYSYILPLNNTD